GTREMRLGLVSTLAGAVTSPAGRVVRCNGSTRICLNFGESGGMTTIPGGTAGGGEGRLVASCLPPQLETAGIKTASKSQLNIFITNIIHGFKQWFSQDVIASLSRRPFQSLNRSGRGYAHIRLVPRCSFAWCR